MGATSIEWTDHSVNPFRARLNGRVGHYCEKPSPGCKNCYSSRMQRRFGMPPFQQQRGADVEHFLDASKLEDVLRRKKPTKWFWCDMTDMFGEWVPNEWIAACFGVMAATPWHTHQILTKRAERMRDWFDTAESTVCGPLEYVGTWAGMKLRVANPLEWFRARCGASWPLPNVWAGVSCEDQQRADERIPHLLSTPAVVRFVSAEPLLGPIEFNMVPNTKAPPRLSYHDGMRGLDWVIVGGESGPGARPFNLAWARSIFDQCEEASRAWPVAFFMKQVGANVFDEGVGLLDDDDPDAIDVVRFRTKDPKGGDWEEWPADIRVREFPGACP